MERAKLEKEFSIPAAGRKGIVSPLIWSRERCLTGARGKLWGVMVPAKKVKLQIPEGFLNIWG